MRAHIRALVSVFLALASVVPVAAQDEFGSGDEWRAPYTVGQRVLFSPSGRANDFKPATVTENTAGDAMRVNVPDSPQRAGGTYVVYGKAYIKKGETATPPKPQPPAASPGVAAPTAGPEAGPAPADDEFPADEAWRSHFKVGDRIRFTISGRKSDIQECTVRENTPGSVMKVECEQFKQWVAGRYIVYNKSHLGGPASKPKADQ